MKKLVPLNAMVDKQVLKLRENMLKLSKQLLEKIQERKAGRQLGAIPSGRRNKLDFKNGHRLYTGTHGWNMVPPSDRESLTKGWKGRKSNWCPNHKAWVEHDLIDCRFNPKKRSFVGKSSKGGKKHKSAEDDDEVTTIMQAIYNEIDSG